MRSLASLTTAIVVAGCVVHLDLEKDKPLHRAVHTGERDQVAFFYSLKPMCEVDVLPEITVVTAPGHGNVSFGNGQDYPDYSPNNIRYDCNKQLVQGTQLFYQSAADFQGADSFVVDVRFANSHVRTITYKVAVH